MIITVMTILIKNSHGCNNRTVHLGCACRYTIHANAVIPLVSKNDLDRPVNPTLSAININKYLDTIQEWKPLGSSLGMTAGELDKIEIS